MMLPALPVLIWPVLPLLLPSIWPLIGFTALAGAAAAKPAAAAAADFKKSARLSLGGKKGKKKGTKRVSIDSSSFRAVQEPKTTTRAILRDSRLLGDLARSERSQRRRGGYGEGREEEGKKAGHDVEGLSAQDC
jgi:hypothetical protein